ncbi:MULTISPECIES: LysR family transcriptional regulator substrate-binding protein [Shewanella]|uniref:LysR family transcriptional regulator substrate-binding protein n=3 Tax=Shewanellaceae TaxID=267890 RepID=A0ABU4QCI7_9GAMM|nr:MULTISPECIES: LysR family transcriptional regulator substrate-binding protein [Shewanella]MCE9790413.1 substrate-binding domain-containing protein [Shewanella indica]MDX6015940.1 LysR family transcriptional regulator substrate-binding protein [Shewanella indica]NDO74955.1 LysR family transcriptional regulator substrate-binding protein [Shewanella sp. SE1]
MNSAKGFNQLGNPAMAGNKNFELVTPGLISYAYPKALMQAIKQQNKQLHINLNSWSCNSLQGLIDGNISAGLCSCHYPQELQSIGSKLQIEALRKLDSLYLICNKNHPLLSRELTLETIAEYPYINTDLSIGPNTLSPFEDYCRINNLDLNVEMTITGISSLSAYLEASQAVALVPYKAVFDLLGEEPLLHLCKLSEMETTRLFNVTEPLTLTLLSPSGQQDPDLEWIRSQLRLVSGTLL